ncbi:hypothetical protein [Streptomyces sp. NPDC051662]|uniref:hypothetical protein n=1 Tax=Streptomyces sp. NPDC051662 TaxID=3154750 RepID=UPI003429EE44
MNQVLRANRIGSVIVGLFQGSVAGLLLAGTFAVLFLVALMVMFTRSGPRTGDRLVVCPDAAAPAKKVDACTLLKPEEVTPIIGENDGGRPDAGVGESVCLWENPDTYHSITLSIGSPGTAVPGKSSSGPDEINFGSGNIAEFIIDDRACTLQVVTSVTDESDRPTMTKLIGLIRPRL